MQSLTPCLLPRAAPTAGPSTGWLQDSSAPSRTGPVPAECEGFIQRDRKQSQRGKSLSLHGLISSVASQATALTEDLFMEKGSWGEQPQEMFVKETHHEGLLQSGSTRHLITAHRELLWGLLSAGSPTAGPSVFPEEVTLLPWHHTKRLDTNTPNWRSGESEWFQDIFALPEVKKAHYLSDSAWHSNNALKSPREDFVLPYLTCPPNTIMPFSQHGCKKCFPVLCSFFRTIQWMQPSSHFLAQMPALSTRHWPKGKILPAKVPVVHIPGNQNGAVFQAISEI